MSIKQIFPYAWYVDDDQQEVTQIRIYGLDTQNKNTCIRINNFTPYVYLELPECNNMNLPYNWTPSKAQLVGNKLDELLGEHKPLSKCLMFKKKLYYADLDDNKQRKLFPFLFLQFSSQADIKILGFKVKRDIQIVGLGKIRTKIHEQDASPILQLTCIRDIPTAGWINFSGKAVCDEEKISTCDNEYVVQWKNLSRSEGSYKIEYPAKPLIMGFDIEVNSTNPSAMPKAEKLGDKVFQISCVLGRQGDPDSKWKCFLLTLGDPDPLIVGEDVEIRKYDTESELLIGYTHFIQEFNPNIIVGYNILGFDIPYMIARAKLNLVIYDFDQQGFIKYAHSKEKTIKWSSSAYKNQEFQFLDAEGRLYVDLLPLVKRDYKMDNYKLKTITTFFLGKENTKDPLDARGIFKCYRIGMRGGEKGRKALGIVGKYCCKDSIITIKLMEKLQTWVGLTEMACVCNTNIFSLYTAGQQIKVFSQVYKKCMTDNFVVEKDGYITAEDEHYTGAHVFDPITGVHDNVVPFDFMSLYPSTIIAYNIDYSTLVRDDSIPDRLCHVVSWADHQACIHDPKVIEKERLSKLIANIDNDIKALRTKRDKTMSKIRKVEIKQEIDKKMLEKKPIVKQRSEIFKTKPKHTMCVERRYRFLKEPKGVMPTILQNLLDARANTRKQMKEYSKKLDSLQGSEKTDLETLITVLDKRQLAYKVSSNSMYGAMGVPKGYLPFMPGAMATTAMGRKNIEIAAKAIQEKFKGRLIYGDSVVPTTPILCEYTDIQTGKNIICYRTIENLSQGNWENYHENKEVSTPLTGYKVWTEKGFTTINKVIRHKCEKEIIRVNVHTGVVDCTTDHSLLTISGEKISPLELKVGSTLLTTDLPNSNFDMNNISVDESYVWGMFFAEGSCGKYDCPSGIKSSWAINNQDTVILEKCRITLNKVEPDCVFKILDTLESSAVYKLVPTGKVSKIVEKYRELFYDNRKYKKVPDVILNSNEQIRQSFLDGYFDGDGCRTDLENIGCYRFDNKGQIGSAGLYYLVTSLGYKASINTREDKLDIFRITCTKKKQRKSNNIVKKIITIGIIDDYVYDLETENHHFSAGPGRLIVHNTDSNYVMFPHLDGKPASELWDYCEYVAKEVSKLFPDAINLAYEEVIYKRFLILTKKRYMYLACDRNGVVSNKVGKKGVLLARRDNSQLIRTLYGDIIMKLFNKYDKDQLLYDLIQDINKLCGSAFPSKDFVVTKAVGAIEDYKIKPLPDDPDKRQKRLDDLNCTEKEYKIKCLPAQVQLAEKMRSRGMRVDAGSRLEYVITVGEGHKAKQSEKVEDADYFRKYAESGILKIDYMYYLKLLSVPLDQVFRVVYGMNDFVLNQYKYRLKLMKVHEELLSLFTPKVHLLDNYDINFIIED